MRASPANQKRALLWPSIAAAAATIVFLAVAYEVEPGPIGVDAPILREVESARTDAGNRIMVAITNFGASAGTTTIVLLTTAALLWSRHWREASFVIVANVGGLVLIRALKAWFARPRPSAEVVMSITHPHSLSFPSGHALSAMVLYGSLVLATVAIGNVRLTRVATVVALVAVPLMGFTRVYLGVHFPTDVLAGWTLGFAWVWLAYLGYRATLTTPSTRA